MPPLANYPLFKHMSNAHGLTLLESELHEIVLAVRQCQVESSLSRYRCDRLTGKIAKDFADILREWFNERYPAPQNVWQWEKMCMMNQGFGPNSSVCASHDWVDANVFMSEAMEKNGVQVFGMNGDEAITDRVSDIWDASWAIAKRKYLT